MSELKTCYEATCPQFELGRDKLDRQHLHKQQRIMVAVTPDLVKVFLETIGYSPERKHLRCSLRIQCSS